MESHYNGLKVPRQRSLFMAGSRSLKAIKTNVKILHVKTNLLALQSRMLLRLRFSPPARHFFFKVDILQLDVGNLYLTSM